MAKRKLPDHIPGSVEAWRRKKRREWRVVEKALNTFWFGSAYVPVESVYELRLHVRRISDALKGRWNP